MEQIKFDVLESDDVRDIVHAVINSGVVAGELATKEFVRGHVTDVMDNLDLDRQIEEAIENSEGILSEDDVDDRVREVMSSEWTEILPPDDLRNHLALDTDEIAAEAQAEFEKTFDVDDSIRQDTEIYERLDTLEERVGEGTKHGEDDNTRISTLQAELNGLVDRTGELAKHVLEQRGQIAEVERVSVSLQGEQGGLKDYIDEQARRITDLAEQNHYLRGVVKQLVLSLGQMADHDVTLLRTIDIEQL